MAEISPSYGLPGRTRRDPNVGDGSVLDHRYRLDAFIGCGGTAAVYRGTDLLLDRAVAIKIFDAVLTDLNSVERQRTEMTLLAALDHPHLVAVHDAHIAESSDATRMAGHSYLVMELVAGVTLVDRLRDGALPAAEAARIGGALAGALTVVHQHELVHRDLKPGNVLMADTGQIKLADFGLARLLTAEQRVTTSAEMMGTPAYFSPEQAAGGEVGPPSDIYSLGLVLLECLTGHREYPGDAVPAAVARLLRDPVIPIGLPAPWPVLLTAMTDAVAGKRPSAAQVTAVLTGDAGEPSSTIDLPRPAQVFLAGTTAGAGRASRHSGPMSEFWQVHPVGDVGSVRGRNARWVGLLAAVAAATVAFSLLVDVGGSAPAAGPPASVDPAAAASSPAGPRSSPATSRPVQSAGTRAALDARPTGPARPTVTNRSPHTGSTAAAQHSPTSSIPTSPTRPPGSTHLPPLVRVTTHPPRPSVAVPRPSGHSAAVPSTSNAMVTATAPSARTAVAQHTAPQAVFDPGTVKPGKSSSAKSKGSSNGSASKSKGSGKSSSKVSGKSNGGKGGKPTR